jgi:hypothetical protein
MTAPTKASLQRELRAMKIRYARVESLLTMTSNAADTLGALTERQRVALEALKAAARPVVAYMDTQWPGSVGPELRRLKELCK